MEQKKNLCTQIPLSLHTQVSEAREAAGQTTSEYITNLLIEYYNLKKDGGTTTMGLIEEALNEAERQAAEEAGQTATPEASVSPCEPSESEEEVLPPEKP